MKKQKERGGRVLIRFSHWEMLPCIWSNPCTPNVYICFWVSTLSFHYTIILTLTQIKTILITYTHYHIYLYSKNYYSLKYFSFVFTLTTYVTCACMDMYINFFIIFNLHLINAYSISLYSSVLVRPQPYIYSYIFFVSSKLSS